MSFFQLICTPLNTVYLFFQKALYPSCKGLYLPRKPLLMGIRTCFTIFLTTFFFCAVAQQRSIFSKKISHAIKVDGNLDDAEWAGAPEATDFITNTPVFGKPAAKKTIVKLLYDNNAVYVGAYMYDSVKNVRRQLSSRDVVFNIDADVIIIGFDTYHDKQNAFVFRLTAAGVQGDARESQGGNVYDNTWDAVWESKVSIKKDGWVAEIKIPFSALRFPKKDVQDWGFNFGRLRRSNNELSLWNPEDPNISGDINQWGVIKEFKNITPPLRLSLLPYISGGFSTSPSTSGNITEVLKNGGMDIKYGINESFTLDMTLIPDFAQVQSDNLFLNLSPFEVKFDDYRPFFTEGTELFNKAGIFYSRRIGARPAGADNVLMFAANSHYDIIKNPGITQLYNATKISGRTKDKLGIGMLNAVTAPMYAKLRNKITGVDSSILTEPLTNYNLFVFDKAFKNRSSISFTNTNVMRKGNSRNANVGSIDLSLFDNHNKHQFTFTGKYSTIWGNNGNSNGYTGTTTFGKVSGVYRYSFGASVESDKYDPNDLGFLQNNNSYSFFASAGYYQIKPTKKLLNHSYTFSVANNYLYNPFHWTDFKIGANAKFLLKSFWNLSANFETSPIWYNDFFEPRTPGMVLKRTPYYYIGLSASSDIRKKAYFTFQIGGAESPLPRDPYWTTNPSFRYRFNNRFQVTTSLNLEQDKGNWGYSHYSGGVPIIARRNVDRRTFIFSAQYGFTQRMNWTIRLRHNWTYLENTNFYTLKNDGYWNEIAFVNGKNKNTNFFNIDMFYTWDFLLGSRLTLAWKNALGNNVTLDAYDNTSYLRNFGKMFNNPHSNEVTLKLVYYLDYLKLRHQK